MEYNTIRQKMSQKKITEYKIIDIIPLYVR